MSIELKKRILTSVFLLLISMIVIILNEIIFILGISLVSIISFYEWNKINTPNFIKKRKRNINFIRFFGLFYILSFLTSSIIIYKEMGSIFFIFILLTCSSSDIGGFIFGKLIGGTKLTKISPNKTISGSIGSFIFSLIPILFFNAQDYFNFTLDLSTKNILFCLVISLSAQLGDLFISYFKRLNKAKDTGKILPGHGGLLDRIDGIIFAIPLTLILLIIF